VREGLRGLGRNVKESLLRRSKDAGDEGMGKFYGFEGADLDDKLERAQKLTNVVSNTPCIRRTGVVEA
jgi:hypothetical protein